MTFDQYIQNPMGIKNAVFSGRDMYRKLYTEKWEGIKLRENGAIMYRLYTTNTDFIVHYKIPSEIVPKFYYDVIIRFYPPKGTGQDVSMYRTLSDYEVQFWSNDPSFVYTFAHAFSANGLLFRDLDKKMVTRALKEKATERNPMDQIGYVKSLYFAYLEMRSTNLFQKVRWDGVSKPYTKKVLLETVEPADDKIRERQIKGEAIRKKEKRMKAAHRNRENLYTGNNTNTTKNISKPNQNNFGHFQSKMKINTIKKTPISGVNKGIGKFKKK